MRRLLFLIVCLIFISSNSYATLDAGTVWEFRTAGSNDNGGGFVPGGSGTDYSQQDAAQLTLTDLATDGAGTALSSVAGGFTAAMVDNIIYIKSGTGFTVGWYEITAHTDTNNVTIDRSAGSSATAGTGSAGGARSLFTDAHFEACIAGNVVWAKAGTYTLTEHIGVSKAGTYDFPIILKGYNSSRGDAPKEDDRPLIAAAAFTLSWGNYWVFKHLRATTTSTQGLKYGIGSGAENCKVYNSSGSGNRSAFANPTGDGYLVDCEGQSTNGYGVSNGAIQLIAFNYFHDSVYGIYGTNFGNCMISNVIDTCTTGIYATGYSETVIGNTVYNCTTGIHLGDQVKQRVVNNIIDSCTTGLRQTGTDYFANLVNYNNFNNNTADTLFASKGGETTSDDPEFSDAPNGDFATTLSANAMPKTTFPGGLTAHAGVQGAVQPPGNGASESSFVSIH